MPSALVPWVLTLAAAYARHDADAKAFADAPVITRRRTEIHEAGLNPHHAAGRDQHDPHLFRHRYQHHDGLTGRVLYYEYEAKRHPHVLMLDDIQIAFCEAEETDDPTIDGGNSGRTTTIKLILKDEVSAAKLSEAAVIAGDGLECRFRTSDGTMSPWRKTLRERILRMAPVVSSDSDHFAISLVTAPAGLNDVFEHAQMEFFHGRAPALDTGRTKRLASLAANGASPPEKYRFASTSAVLADAKAADENKRRAKLGADPVSPPVLAEGTNSSHQRRQLLCLLGGGVQDWPSAGRVEIGGVDCNDGSMPSSAMDATNCHWRSNDEDADSSNDKLALKEGNTYMVNWTGAVSASSVKVYIVEKSSWLNGGDDHCVDIATSASNQYYTGGIANTPNMVTFTMPKISEMPCANDGLGGFPEFMVVVKSTTCQPGCSNPSSCYETKSRNAEEFEILTENDVVTDTLVIQPSQSTFNFGSQAVGAEIQCTDCKVTGSADVHILVRTESYNPFEEAWVWGDLNVSANIDMQATAFAVGETEVFERALLDLICIQPVCYGTTLAGLSMKVGLMADLTGTANATFDATATLSYKRNVQATGPVALHSHGGTTRSEMGEFVNVDQGGADTAPQCLNVDVSANATVGLIPDLYLGMFASLPGAIIGAEAEVYVRAGTGLWAEANFKMKASNDNFAPFLPRTTSECDSKLLGCGTGCTANHDTSVDAKIYGRFSSGHKMYAAATFGPWGAAYGEANEVVQDYHNMSWGYEIGSWCWNLIYLSSGGCAVAVVVEGGEGSSTSSESNLENSGSDLLSSNLGEGAASAVAVGIVVIVIGGALFAVYKCMKKKKKSADTLTVTATPVQTHQGTTGVAMSAKSASMSDKI